MFGDRIKLFGFFVLSVLNIFVTLVRKLLDTHYSLREPKDNLDVDETNNKEHEKEQDISWSELDRDLLGEIRGRLCLADQLRFQVVCKNWLHAHPITAITKPLLWYLSFDRSLFELQLHDPSSSHPASVQNISLTKFGIPSPSFFQSVSSIVLDHNWLFILIRKPRFFFWKLRRYILLFSPFTKKFITLPTFDYPCLFKYHVLTSSTQPDSPDCVFFLLDTCNADKVTVLTYRNGDKEWTAKKFNRVSDFKPCYCSPVYLGGILYVVSPSGQLASYNIVDGEFKFESLFIDELFRLNIRSRMQYIGFELNGELMMINFVLYEKKHVTIPGKPCIKKYNWSNKDWIPVSTLGDKSLFLSEKSAQVVIIKKDDMRNNGVLPNKIYQFFNGGCLIYSIEDGDLVEFKSVNSNLLEEGGGDLPEYKYKGGSLFFGTKKAIYWLESPHVSS